MKTMQKIGWQAVVCALSGTFWGASLSQAEEQERVLESSRFLGRGNTYVAGYDSDEAVRGNPATLGEASKLTWQVRWLQFDAMIGKNSLDTVSDLTSLDGSQTAVTLLQKFQDKFGKRQYARLQLSPFAVRILKFEIAPFVSSSSYVDMHLPTTPEIAIKSDTIAGVNVAFGYPLGKDVTLGINLRPAQRIYLAGGLAFSDVVDFLPPTSRDIADVIPMKNKTMVGADLGATWVASKAWRFGLLVENAGYTSSLDGGSDAPPAIPQRVSVGSVYRMEVKSWHLDFLTDVQDLGNGKAYNPLRLIHLGTELGRSLWTRDHDLGLLAGLNEGYFTGGLFADLWLVRLDVVNYAVELGEYPGQRMDRRWAASARVTTTW